MPRARRAAAVLRDFARADSAGRRATLETLLLDRIIRRPIVFTDSRGLRYVLHPGENAGVYIAAGGNYEIAETRFCEEHLCPGATVLDVGANIGLYALLCGRLAGPTGLVHAFEPEALNASRLRENIALNGLGNVQVFEVAAYSHPGTVELNVFAPSFNSWHSIGRPKLPDPRDATKVVDPVSTRTVTATTLDDHCAKHGLQTIDLLKIDVEGAELDVLAGAQALLAERVVRSLLFEVSLPQIEALGHEPGAVFELLAGAGYRCRRLLPDGSPGETVERAVERYANYVAHPSDQAG
jgi:FkbM family methyltransferase